MPDQLDCEFVKVRGHRDRLEDVPLLVAHFLKKYNREFKNEITAISDDILTIF
jgi:transcriptional regulator with PAS, ATPase and Fis domain